MYFLVIGSQDSGVGSILLLVLLSKMGCWVQIWSMSGQTSKSLMWEFLAKPLSYFVSSEDGERQEAVVGPAGDGWGWLGGMSGEGRGR